MEVPLKDIRTEYSIPYTTNDGYTIYGKFNNGLLSNIYANGVGTFTFGSPVTMIISQAFFN